MKKRIAVLLIAILTFCLPIAVAASSLGYASDVLCGEVRLIKSGLRGQKMTFSEADFKQLLAVPSVKKVKILTLPDENAGVLILGETKVVENEVIPRRAIGALRFVPASAEVTGASFTFCVPGAAGNGTMACEMKFLDKVNGAPVAAESAALLTQSGIPIRGQLGGTDPEGDEIEYIVLTYPKNGTLTLTDKTTGTYRYTPQRKTVGTDSFRYVLRDCFGNYSTVCEASIKVDERLSEVTYTDMEDSDAYVAAVTLDALGVMHGFKDGDSFCFAPEETVGRAEFLSMAMKVCSVKCEKMLTKTFFDDDDEIPDEYRVYVANAQKKGIVNGAFEGTELNFRPCDPITGAEASVILSHLIGATESTAASADSSVPAWARSEVGAVAETGIFKTEEGAYRNALTREQAAAALYGLARYLEK